MKLYDSAVVLWTSRVLKLKLQWAERASAGQSRPERGKGWSREAFSYCSFFLSSIILVPSS